MAAWIDTAGATSVRRRVDTTNYVGWARGRLAFEGTPLRGVTVALERWYDVDIQLSGSALGSRRVSAQLEDQPLQQLLDQLRITLQVRITRVGRQITLTPVQ